MNRSSDEILGDLNWLLNIPNLGCEDSDLIFADANRVDEFCNIYEQESLGADEKYALMGLIIASYNRYLHETNHLNNLEHRVSKLLEKDFELHKDSIEYWGRIDCFNRENLWAVSPLMQEILDKHYK